MKEIKQKDFFEFFPTRFFMDTVGWEAEAVGIYIRLLCHEWVSYKLPKGELSLMKLGGTKNRKMLEVVLSKFTEIDGRYLINKTLEEIRNAQLSKKKHYQKIGIDSANKRWGSFKSVKGELKGSYSDTQIPAIYIKDNSNSNRKRGSGGKTLTPEFCLEKMNDSVFIAQVQKSFLDHGIEIPAVHIRQTIQSVIDYCTAKNKWKTYHDLAAVCRSWIRRDLKTKNDSIRKKTRAQRYDEAAGKIPTIE